MFLGIEPDQAGSDQQATGQIETRTGRMCQQGLQRFLPVLRWQRREVRQRQLEVCCWHDHLRRHAVGSDEARTQHFMTTDHFVQRLAQCGDVQLTVQAYGSRQVIEPAARLQLIEEPQALLRMRQRQRCVPVRMSDRGRCRTFSTAPRRVSPSGQFGQHRCFEHRAERQFDTEHFPQARQHLRRQQRMTAQVEEMILCTDAVEFQHRRPDTGEYRLRFGTRLYISGYRVARVRCRQGRPVEFAVRRQRQRIQHHEVRRHHVIRQRLLQVRAQVRGLDRIAIGHDIGNQSKIAVSIRARHHGHIAHTLVPPQRHFDLTWFDTETTNLDLMIDAANVFDIAIGPVAREIARAIHSATRRAERVRHETLCAQVRTVQVPAGQTGSADIQLPHHTQGRWLPLAVQQINPRVRNRTTNRHTPCRQCPGHFIGQRITRDFR
jgi:hypothetical protein